MKSQLIRFLLIFAISLSAVAAEEQKPAEKKATLSDEIVLQPNSPQLDSLKIEPVIEITAPATEPLNGKIVFDENYTARVSSPLLGRATSIKAQIGDKVKAGQVLMVMDSPDLGSAVSDAKKADADLEMKQKAMERNRMLLEGGVIALKDFESSESDLAQSKAEAERANARLNNLGIKHSLNQTYTVRAPISGTIVDRQVNPGTEVRPDAAAPLFTITNPDHLWASIDLPERDLGKIEIGQALSISVEAYPDETFNGHVKAIGVVVDPTTRRIPVHCIVESKGKLKAEMYAKITPLSLKSEKVIQLPNTALITEGLYNYVFVETSPGHIKKRRIVLNVQDRDYATVKEGLQVGDKVVTVGAILLNSELMAGK